MLQSNSIYNTDCFDSLLKVDNNSVDMVLFSPPYDSIRDYNKDWELDLHKLGSECFRILKPSRNCCVIIQDQIKHFKKSCTTYKTIIDWTENIGFGLFENCIYERSGSPGAWWNTRFRVDNEFILMFTKPDDSKKENQKFKPGVFSKEHLKVPANWGGDNMSWAKNHAVRTTSGELKEEKNSKNPDMKCRGTIWDYTKIRSLENMKGLPKNKHPATFPLKIAEDLILTFTDKGELVLDPLCGSGTTCVAAKNNERDYIGIDIGKDYCDIAEEWLKL